MMTTTSRSESPSTVQRHCHHCNEMRTFEWNCTRRVQFCLACRARFPCVRRCTHSDCQLFLQEHEHAENLP
jgi:hypothetical protein